MINVQTFGQAELRAAARQLLRLVDESGFRPELVVAIAEGGRRVVETIEDELASRNVRTVAIVCRRAGTRTKQTLRMRAWIARLPLSLRDLLRICEHYLRALLDGARSGRARGVDVVAPAGLGGRSWARILVVDDAVDSGDTLSAIDRYLRRQCPDADIRYGALVQTRRNAARAPDYVLHRSVLIRFPWSYDFRAGGRAGGRAGEIA